METLCNISHPTWQRMLDNFLADLARGFVQYYLESEKIVKISAAHNEEKGHRKIDLNRMVMKARERGVNKE